jgi:DNA (cytosine-5)-methyltransferase 3A
MNVLSLFDGLSGARIALERAKIKIENYFASEIDKYAIQISNKNYSDIIQLGDINNWQDWNLPKIDLLIGGSPCQGFSFAGKQLNFNDERSKLFFKYIDILNHYKPKYFLLENVKMKKEYQNVITDLLNVEPIEINSALVSAQNRKRLYWCNWEVVQPKDEEIYLKDIIEKDVVDRDKSYCIDTNYFKGTNINQYFEKHRRHVVFNKPKKIAEYGKGGQSQRIYSVYGKSAVLNISGGGQGGKTGLYVVSERGRRLTENGTKRDDKNGKLVRGYEVISNKKINCLNCLTTIQNNYIVEELIIRKLTPLECERLQTVPNNYTEGVSNTQRYKMLGNGFTVDVIVHIINELKKYEKI